MMIWVSAYVLTCRIDFKKSASDNNPENIVLYEVF